MTSSTMSESPAAVERTPSTAIPHASSYNTGRPKKRTSSTASSPSHTPSAWSSSQLSTSLPSSFDPARPERPIKAFRTLSSPRLQTMQPWSSHEREALYVAVQRMNLFGRWDQVQARMGLERSPDEIAREYMRLYGELHDDDFEDDDDHDEYEYEDEEDDEGWHLSRQEMEDRSEDDNESNARALASGGGGGSGGIGGGGGGGGGGRLATPALTAASSTASLSARSSQETFSGPLFHRPSQPTPSEGSYHARPSTRPSHHPTCSSPSSSSPLQSFPYPSSKSPQRPPSQQFRYSPPQSAALPHGYSPSAGGPPSPRNLYHHPPHPPPPAQPLHPSKEKSSSQHAYPSRRAGGMEDPLDEDCDEMRIDHVEPPPSRARPTATGNSGGNNKGETDVTRRRFDGKPTRTVRVWTLKQSEQLKRLIEDCFPDGYRINWVWVAAQMGNTFTRKQCKNKWEIMRRRAGTEEEIHLLRQGLREFGTSWSQIQEKYLPERSQGGISIMWNLLQEREAEQRRQQLDPSSAERPWPTAVPPRPSPRSPRARSASSSSVPTTISRTTGAGRGGSHKGVKERAGSGHMEANAQAHDYGSSMDTTMTTATPVMMTTTTPPPMERTPGTVHRYSRENSEDEHLHSYPHHRQQHHSSSSSSPYHQQPQQQQPLPLSSNQQRPNPRGGSEYFSSSKVSSADMPLH